MDWAGVTVQWRAMSSIHIERHGLGPKPLVLLHGWAMHGGIFATLIEALTAQYTLYVVDLPGHGHSRNGSVPLTLDDCARAIVEVTPPAIWVGWSLGGLIALHAASEYPRNVLALGMLCASPCFVRGADWPHGVNVNVFRRFAGDLDHDYRGTLLRFLALEAMGSADAKADTRALREIVFARGEPDKHALQQGMVLLEETDLRSTVSQLSQPSVWIAGARDRLVSSAAMQWGATQCQGSFAAMEHAGHAPFLGAADRVAECMHAAWPQVSAG